MPHVPIDAERPGPGRTPEPPVPPSVFHGLTVFVSQAGSFPPDSPRAKAMCRAIERVGEGSVVVQFGDPKTHDGNVTQLVDHAYAERFRRDVGAAVLGWHRVEHRPEGTGAAYANELSEEHDLDGWIFNVETPKSDPLLELRQVPALASGYRAAGHLGFIVTGKLPGFDVRACQHADGHLFAECFRESPGSDFSVANCHDFWTASTSALAPRRFHPTLPDPTFGLPVDHRAELAEAKRLGVEGVAIYVGENTPPALFDLIGAP